MVLASICEHASSAFIFASTSSDQFSHASSEHFRNYKWRSQRALCKFSASWNLESGIWNLSKGQILRALSNWMRPFDTPPQVTHAASASLTLVLTSSVFLQVFSFDLSLYSVRIHNITQNYHTNPIICRAVSSLLHGARTQTLTRGHLHEYKMFY